jgi:hypothetical protein
VSSTMVDCWLVSVHHIDNGFGYLYLVTALVIIIVESIAQHGKLVDLRIGIEYIVVVSYIVIIELLTQH